MKMGVNNKNVETLYEVQSTKVVACKIDVNLPRDNPKHTSFEVKVYTGLALKMYKQLYLVAMGKTVYQKEFTAPVGAIVYVHYVSGSTKHVYIKYSEFFIVDETGETQYQFNIKSYGKIEGISGSLKNLRPLSIDANRVDVEAEVMNKYNAKLSDFDPVEVLYTFWMKERSLEDEIKQLEELIRQKEEELKILKEKLAQLKSRSS
ncbi:MAG: hypothetical protein QXT28_07050 [Thermofilaceae archaeon]